MGMDIKVRKHLNNDQKVKRENFLPCVWGYTGLSLMAAEGVGKQGTLFLPCMGISCLLKCPMGLVK